MEFCGKLESEFVRGRRRVERAYHCGKAGWIWFNFIVRDSVGEPIGRTWCIVGRYEGESI